MKKTIISLLSATLTMFGTSSCAKSPMNTNVKTNTYVLVHGAWQAPYVWETVEADLVKKGNKVIVVELPGHGKDTTPTYALSLDAYRDKVVEAINKTNGKVILVGHSMGGMVITSVAEKIPDRISKLVYIGAFVPANGQALGELAMRDPGSKLGPSLSQSADKLTLNVNPADLINLFIADGTTADKEKVMANYRPEPAIPFGNPVILTKERFGAVEKVYIKTMNDVVISPAFQDQIIAIAGIKTVYQVNTSHSPFLAQPKAVADLLLTIGQ